MRTVVQEVDGNSSPELLARTLADEAGLVLLRSGGLASPQSRYSFVAVRPFLTFRCYGSRCELRTSGNLTVQFGNPWSLLGELISRYEIRREQDLPFPLGGCFGYWGYDLKNFVEPKLPRRAPNDLELPDAHLGFYDSFVVFDHHLGKNWIISTGLSEDGTRSERRALSCAHLWREWLESSEMASIPSWPERRSRGARQPTSNLTRAEFVARVQRAKEYIRSGDIYQVNLAQRFTAPMPGSGWHLFQALAAASPAPFSAFLDCGEFQLASSSPELFLRLSAHEVQTRPIKGTRPRSSDSVRDAQLSYELQTSPKELAELVMITDLLRNDLGKICEFGTVQVPELVRLERYSHVQHLVSTVEGRLRPGLTHAAALGACFPGGSITGAPKFRAMEIIDELEPVARGPYTGALGYLGFNGESQLSIIIRSAVCVRGGVWFHSGAGIVADSDPEAEYEETVAKARGFFEALRHSSFLKIPRSRLRRAP